MSSCDRPSLRDRQGRQGVTGVGRRLLLNPLRRLLQFSPAQLADRLELQSDERVLDLGFGPGYHAASPEDVRPYPSTGSTTTIIGEVAVPTTK